MGGTNHNPVNISFKDNTGLIGYCNMDLIPNGESNSRPFPSHHSLIRVRREEGGKEYSEIGYGEMKNPDSIENVVSFISPKTHNTSLGSRPCEAYEDPRISDPLGDKSYLVTCTAFDGLNAVPEVFHTQNFDQARSLGTIWPIPLEEAIDCVGSEIYRVIWEEDLRSRNGKDTDRKETLLYNKDSIVTPTQEGNWLAHMRLFPNMQAIVVSELEELFDPERGKEFLRNIEDYTLDNSIMRAEEDNEWVGLGSLKNHNGNYVGTWHKAYKQTANISGRDVEAIMYSGGLFEGTTNGDKFDVKRASERAIMPLNQENYNLEEHGREKSTLKTIAFPVGLTICSKGDRKEILNFTGLGDGKIGYSGMSLDRARKDMES